MDLYATHRPTKGALLYDLNRRQMKATKVGAISFAEPSAGAGMSEEELAESGWRTRI